MINPDFIAIAKAYGIAAKSVDQREELSSAIATMLNTPGPYFPEVRVEKEDNVFPMILLEHRHSIYV